MTAVLAHGIGSRTDLPLPLWLFTYGAGIALVISFVALRALWPRPRLAALSGGRDLWQPSRRVRQFVLVTARGIGFGLFIVVVLAAIIGVADAAANVAPVTVYVIFWVGLQLLSAVLGDVWQLFSPFLTLTWLAGIPERTPRPDPGQWTAAALFASFAWLELCYYDPSNPRAIATWLAFYTFAVLVGANLWGRAWVRTGEGFAGVFGVLAHLAPFWRDPETDRIRLRTPFSGLATMPVRSGTIALIITVLGSTTFDGYTRARFDLPYVGQDLNWSTIVQGRSGWELTALNTVGLVWVIALVAVAYLGATRITGRFTQREPIDMANAFVASLVPIVLAYSIAHYFSLLVFEGQNFLALMSDPFGKGWDLFGTIDNPVNYRAVSTDTIAYVQAGAIVVGHVAGVAVAHDRSVELFKPKLATLSQYPLLGVMVLYTVSGLALLLGG